MPNVERHMLPPQCRTEARVPAINPMKVPGKIILTAVLLLGSAVFSAPNPPTPLRLVQMFKLPSDVTGRFDHFGVDLQGNRLFLAGESIHEVLVLNLTTGAMMHRIRGVEIPHAIAFRTPTDRIYVTDGGAGELKIFEGHTYALVKTIKLQLDADSLTTDPSMHDLYIVNGGEDAHQPDSLVSVVNTNTNSLEAQVTIGSPHVEAMALDATASRLYVNNTGKNSVDVVDLAKNTVVASWSVTLCKQNVPAAIDEAAHRLFIGCRSGKISVIDTQTGKEVAGLPIAQGIDDLIFNQQNKRLYASCGAGDGSVYVYQQESADQYQPLGEVTTGPGARNSRYVPHLHQLYVSVPAHQGASAEILVYRDR